MGLYDMGHVASHFRANVYEGAINLIRTTPPAPSWVGGLLQSTLRTIADEVDLAALVRTHRFEGFEEDRQLGADWLSNRLGSAPAANRIIVTGGAQNAVMMALVGVVGRGGALLAENITYHGLLKLASLAGVEVVPIDMDGEGALPDSFEKACRVSRPGALYLNPTLQNPTTSVMGLERRKAIAEVARRYGVAIIEDDVYGWLPQESPPSFAELAPDITWHANSPAKCIGPSIRIGFLVAPSFEDRERALKPFQTVSTWFVSPLSAEIFNRWIKTGETSRLVAAVREEATERQALARDILAGATFQTHPQALNLWLELDGSYSQHDFVTDAAHAGVIVRSGDIAAIDPTKAPNALRIVLGSPKTRDELETGLDRLAKILRQHDVLA